MEILIAVFILAIVLSTIYAAYRGTFRIIKEAEDDGEIYSMARTAMDRMFKDLSAFSNAGGTIKFVSRSQETGQGESNGLTFVSGAHFTFSDEESPSGLAEITYYIDEDQNGEGNYRLLRRDVSLAETDGEEQRGDGFFLCERLHSLTFKFFDNAGNEHGSWDSASDAETQRNRAPAMVVIELKLANHRDEDRPYTFTTKVFLPLSTVVSPSP